MLKWLWLQELNLTLSNSLGRQMEVQIAFAPAASSSQGGQQPFSVGIQLSTGQGTSTLIMVNGTAAAMTNGTLQVSQVPANTILTFLSSFKASSADVCGVRWSMLRSHLPGLCLFGYNFHANGWGVDGCLHVGRRACSWTVQRVARTPTPPRRAETFPCQVPACQQRKYRCASLWIDPCWRCVVSQGTDWQCSHDAPTNGLLVGSRACFVARTLRKCCSASVSATSLGHLSAGRGDACMSWCVL